MKDFIPIYDKMQESMAKKQVKTALFAYVLVAMLYAAICAAFLVLYVVVELTVYVCCAVNIVATVAFIWYSVLFFSFSFAQKRQNLRFFRAADNAQFTAYRGKYLQCGDTVKEGRLSFTSVQFDTPDGVKTFLWLEGTANTLRDNATYDLQAVGNKLWAYKEIDK